MVFGLTDGNLWYIPHREAYENGGYGVSFGPNGPLDDSYREQQAGLGERLLEAWLEMMYEQAETDVGREPSPKKTMRSSMQWPT
ncbi:MAG: hypothetical protein ACYTG0_35935 [Planctomycetota bacterium]|jgi:hypothetical protein